MDKLFHDSNEQTPMALICDTEDRGILLRRVHESPLRQALDTIAAAV